MDSTGNGSAYRAVPEQFKRLHGWMASGGGVDGKGLTDAEGYNVSRAVADVWRSFEEVVEEDHERGCGIGWVIQSGYVVFDLDDAVDELFEQTMGGMELETLAQLRDLLNEARAAIRPFPRPE